MKTSSFFLSAAAVFFGISTVMLVGSKDPTDVGFISFLAWASVATFVVFIATRAYERVQARKIIHRLEEADGYRHTGVR